MLEDAATEWDTMRPAEEEKMMASAEEEEMLSAAGSLPGVEADTSHGETTKWLQMEHSNISADTSFP